MAEAILNGLTSNKHRLLKEKLTEQRDKLFHMSQQQQPQQQQQQEKQNSKLSESEKHPTDGQASIVTTAPAAGEAGYTKGRDSVGVVSTTTAISTSTPASVNATTSTITTSSSASTAAIKSSPYQPANKEK